MQTFHPFKSYLRVFILCTVIVIVFLLFQKHHKEPFVGLIYALGLACILPGLIFNPRVKLSNDSLLTYKTLFYTRTVNLAKLTNCNYYLLMSGRSLPIMWLHLYDADGGNATFPANLWSNSKTLYAAIRQAVTTQHVSVNEKTAKKIGANFTQPSTQ